MKSDQDKLIKDFLRNHQISIVKVGKPKPRERHRDGTGDTYNTSVQSCKRQNRVNEIVRELRQLS